MDRRSQRPSQLQGIEQKSESSRYLTGIVTRPTTVITGTTHGIGRVAAQALAQAGHRVVMLVRDPQAGDCVCDEIRAVVPDAPLRVVPCDLASLTQIRRATEVVCAEHGLIDRLIHNAGTVATRAQATVDGYEKVFATNHLGPFLLNQGLMHRMADGGRVIVVASCAHERARLSAGPRAERGSSPGATDDGFGALDAWADPTTRGWGARQAYSRSKLANILFTFALARRLSARAQGARVTAHCLHPGIVHTHLLPVWLRWIKPLVTPGMIDAQAGAQTLLHLALSPNAEALHGRYLDEHQRIATPSVLARDVNLQEALWARSLRWSGLPAEPDISGMT